MNMDIISAFAEGKTIQYKTVTGVWGDLTESEGLPMGTLEEEPNNFRVKPETKFRPFANADECWNEMQKHQPFIKYKVIESSKDVYLIIQRIKTDGIETDVERLDFETAFECFTFADGVPFGVKEEQLWQHIE